MLHQENQYKTKDGFKLFSQSWLPSQPKAHIALIHGLGEHSARYANFAKYMCEHEFAVNTFDLRYHGKSDGQPRGFVNAFEDYLDDVDLHMNAVSSLASGKPLFLMGHSMGGAICSLYAITRKLTPNAPVHGLILSSAALKLDDGVSPILIALSGLMGKLLPTLPTLKIDPALVSRDPAIVNGASDDPLCYYGGTRARTGAELIRAINLINQHASEITLPILLFHGTADKLTNPQGSKRIYETVSSIDKTLNMYEGSYHETLNDLDRAKVMADIVAWLKLRI
jgi:alpha-beta hydrolase superfamily lysophospholipase